MSNKCLRRLLVPISRLRILTVILTVLLVFSFLTQAPVARSAMNPTLLLDSGLVRASEAEVKVVVWLPKKDGAVARSLLPKDWEWKVRTGGPGFSAESTRTITDAGEKGLMEWYIHLAKTLKSEHGQVYLEERVHEALDIEHYFVLTDAVPLQWAHSAGTVSLSGNAPGLGEPVLAGSDPINIQVLTRVNERGGETMLALPVLLTEF